MDYMKKEEMIQCLKDFSKLEMAMENYPNVSLNNLFSNMMLKQSRLNDLNDDYLNKIKNVSLDYILSKQLCFVDDFVLNRDDYYVNNLNYLSNNSNLSSNEMVKLIRNSFNTSNYNLSLNGDLINVNIDDIRTRKEILNRDPIKPFNFSYDITYLDRILLFSNRNRKNVNFFYYDIPSFTSHNLSKAINKISLNNCFITNKLTSKEISIIREFDFNDNLYNLVKKLNCVSKKYYLTDIQKEKVIDIMNDFSINFPQFYKREVINYALSKVMPFSSIKEENLITLVHVLNNVYNSPEFSLNRMNYFIDEHFNGRDYFYNDCFSYNNFNKQLNSVQKMIKFDIISHNNLGIDAKLLYIEAVLNNCLDNDILIDNTAYSKNIVVNALKHGRYFISKENELIIYNLDPNTLNLELYAKIDINKLEIFSDSIFKNPYLVIDEESKQKRKVLKYYI